MGLINFQEKFCQGYELIFERSIGGFLYLGFMPDQDRLICVSGEYISIIELLDGQVTKVVGDYDEEELLVFCEGVEKPVSIAGQYGGSLPQTNQSGVAIQTYVDPSGPYPICSIFWKLAEQEPCLIYKSYLPYIYGFSEDGRYYVHVDDGSLSVLRKKES
ncbi:hypothetical protein V9Z23_03815 [Streptococcus suis]|uniref:hypothetical protein n=2 Tax=Streptococcus suis TaxID=1307 RepID=UPI00300F8726